jgi:hypothetical protein
MSSSSLSYHQAWTATILWGAPTAASPVATDTRAWLEHQPAAMPWLAQIDADRLVLASAPADGSPYALLTDALEQADTKHDARARFIVATLHAYIERGGALGSLAKEMLTVFFPDGASLVNDTILGEAARVTARATALTADARTKLARFSVGSDDGGSRTLLDDLVALQSEAAEVGRIWNDRASLASGGALPAPSDLLAAKRRLISTVRDILGSFGRLAKLGPPNGLDGTGLIKYHTLRDTWNEAVAQATANAAARNAAAGTASTGTPATPPSA